MFILHQFLRQHLKICRPSCTCTSNAALAVKVEDTSLFSLFLYELHDKKKFLKADCFAMSETVDDSFIFLSKKPTADLRVISLSIFQCFPSIILLVKEENCPVEYLYCIYI